MSKSPPLHSTIASLPRADASAFVAPRAMPAAPTHWPLVWKRRIARYSRWLHVYVSMASFVVVFFFAVTGLTLNHTEWFAGSERTTEVKGTLDAGWTKTADDKDVRKLEIGSGV